MPGAELVEQEHLGADQAAPVGEMQALVLAVDVRAGIVGTHQQRGDAAERVGERADERDRATDAHQHRFDPEAGVQRAPRRVERGAGRVGLPRGRAFERGERALESPRHVRFDVRAQGREHPLGFLARTEPHADAAPWRGRRSGSTTP